MTNAEINRVIFDSVGVRGTALIASHVAKNLGITLPDAIDELRKPEAMPLLDYMTGKQREAVSKLMPCQS